MNPLVRQMLKSVVDSQAIWEVMKISIIRSSVSEASEELIYLLDLGRCLNRTVLIKHIPNEAVSEETALYLSEGTICMQGAAMCKDVLNCCFADGGVVWRKRAVPILRRKEIPCLSLSKGLPSGSPAVDKPFLITYLCN